MKIDDLTKYGVNEKYIERFKSENIQELYPPQADVIKGGLFKEKNLILSVPTASGKTFIATIAMIHKLTERKKQSKLVYIAPLVALAYEKYNYFKNFFGREYKIGISVGNLDSSDNWLSNYDIICITTEKLDSLLRHNVSWVENIDLVIVDEIHLLNDPSRGPTLEILLTKLIELVPNAQIFGLSATINNANELGKWINANIVISDFRPVKLHEGVYHDSKIHFQESEGYAINSLEDPENGIIENTLELGKQALIFCSTRRNAESLAERLTKTVKRKLKKDERFKLEKVSEEIVNVLEIPTKQCKELAKFIKNGVAFHHAGLLGKQKRSIEDNFRNKLIKVIVATPTLAMGVNLPAFRVIIKEARRYYQGFGMVYIPVMEYKQFVGRAGRPQYDDFGESILMAKTEDEAHELVNRFIFGEPEKITSKLAVQPILRMHTLALIASRFCNSEETLMKFFRKTFYSHQYKEISLIEENLKDLIEQLIEWKFIVKEKNKLQPTTLGKRVSELYIDPLTAFNFVDGLKKAPERNLNETSFLQLVLNTLEMRPLPSVRVSELGDMSQIVMRYEKHFLANVPEEYDLDFEDFIKSVKLTVILQEWINEQTEDRILSKYKFTPGELRGRLELVDWLIHSLHEIAVLQNQKNILTMLKKLRIRLEYGIREELIPLVKLKGVGRVRARRLYNFGMTSIDELRKSPIENLFKIVGTKVAVEIKNHLGEKVELKVEKQSNLNKF